MTLQETGRLVSPMKSGVLIGQLYRVRVVNNVIQLCEHISRVNRFLKLAAETDAGFNNFITFIERVIL